MAAAAAQTRFEQALGHLAATSAAAAGDSGGPRQVSPDELLQRYPLPPLPSSANVSTADAVATLHACEFFRDFAAEPAAVNAQLATERRETRGVPPAVRGDRHHASRKQRQFDFRLQPLEEQRLAREGVAVAQRLRAESFAEAYYRLYTDDLPVFVTADSILHAWHRSFDAVLVDIETLECLPSLTRVLQAASARCHTLLAASVSSPDPVATAAKWADRYTQVLLDVDLLLAVALRLLSGAAAPSALTCVPSNAARVTALERAIAAQQMATVPLFAGEREVDFSRFQPRGHYTKSKQLRAYFQAMTWLGTVDLRVAGQEWGHTAHPGDEDGERRSELHQLQCAVALVGLLRQDGGMRSLSALDALVSSLVGDGDVGADSLTPMQLDALLPASWSCEALMATYVEGGDGSRRSGDAIGAASAAWIPPPALLALQQEIVAKGLGVQLICGHPHVASDVDDASAHRPTALPTSFALFGQRFVWSSFVFSRLVFDQVAHIGDAVVRRLPSAVDVAFSLLGNNAAGVVAAQRMQLQRSSEHPASGEDGRPPVHESLQHHQQHHQDPQHHPDQLATDFVRLRDGVPYASNLIALREAIDAKFEAESESKEPSVSTLWLSALRRLSAPSANAAPVFHSRTWHMRQLNTQLASFTQLRHDSLLYAKQSYTLGTRCEYAAGFVDPYPAFYASMRTLARRMVAIVTGLTSPSVDAGDSDAGSDGGDDDGSLIGRLLPRRRAPKTTMDDLKDRGEFVFATFADTMATLEGIAVRQAQRQPLSDEQTEFVKSVMEERFGSGATKYAGWYPSLFYAKREDAGERDVLVADVHTDVPSVEHGDPLGGVLHLGVGDVHFGFFVVDGAVYSGPVFSSYEFVTASASERLNDAAFEKRLADATRAPSAPDWATRTFLC